jgi:hypothetical protein
LVRERNGDVEDGKTLNPLMSGIHSGDAWTMLRGGEDKVMPHI